jgi:circadian clock protein KaiC
MDSIGLHLKRWVDAGLLHFHTSRTTMYGPEMHLLTVQKMADEFKPSVVVIDPITNLLQIASPRETKTLLVRLIDYFKHNNITTLFTSLTQGGVDEESSEIEISSLMDAWILLRDLEVNGERNRLIYVLKARGVSHSNQVREFRLTGHGIEITDVYVGPGGVLTGSARQAQEAAEAAHAEARRRELERKRRELERKRRALQAQIEALQTEFESEENELHYLIEQDELSEKIILQNRREMAVSRRADADAQDSTTDNHYGDEA